MFAVILVLQGLAYFESESDSIRFLHLFLTMGKEATDSFYGCGSECK